MKRPKDILINLFQLNRLLNEEEPKEYAHLLSEGVFCLQYIAGDSDTKAWPIWFTSHIQIYPGQ